MSVFESLNRITRPQGEMSPYELHAVEKGLVPGTMKSLSLGLLTWDSLENCNGLPYSKARMRPSALKLCKTSQAWDSCEEETVVKSLDDLLRSKSNVLAYDKSGAFIKQSVQQAYYPKLGWSWLVNEEPEALMLTRRIRQGERCWFAWKPGGPVDYPMAVVPGDGNLILLPSILRLCLDWLRNEDLFEKFTTNERLDTRFAFGHQLSEVYTFTNIAFKDFAVLT